MQIKQKTCLDCFKSFVSLSLFCLVFVQLLLSTLSIIKARTLDQDLVCPTRDDNKSLPGLPTTLLSDSNKPSSLHNSGNVTLVKLSNNLYAESAEETYFLVVQWPEWVNSNQSIPVILSLRPGSWNVNISCWFYLPSSQKDYKIIVQISSIVKWHKFEVISWGV